MKWSENKKHVKSAFLKYLRMMGAFLWMFTLFKYLYFETEVRIIIKSGMKKAKINKKEL